MVDIILFVGKLLLLALLYLFLIAAVRAGLGRVAVAAPGGGKALMLRVVDGPRPLRGTRVPLTSPVVIGRSPDADIVIADDFVSGRHARIVPSGEGAVLEDLGSTNGTVLNGTRLGSPATLSAGDEIALGAVHLKVEKA